MHLDNKLIDKLAELARLEYKGEDREAIRKDLNKILDFVAKLEELDTSTVEPLVYVNEEVNNFRNDRASLDISHEEALKNAPLHDSDYIKLAKVIKKDKGEGSH